MKLPGADLPVVVTKWYSYVKWVLERVESFPKSQRFILGQRLANHVMDVLETMGGVWNAQDETSIFRIFSLAQIQIQQSGGSAFQA